MPKLLLTSITPTADGTGRVRLTVLIIGEDGNEVYGAGSGEAFIAGDELATALASGNAATKAAAVKALILAARPDWAQATVNAINAANSVAVTQATALTKLVPELPYKFTL